MSFDKFQIKNLISKWLPLLIVSISILLLISGWPKTFVESDTSRILVIVTICYVYLTYEMLKISKKSRNLPYLSIEFIAINKLEEWFVKKYGKYLRKNENFRQLQREQESAVNKDVVFVKIENVGDAHAIDVSVKISYGKKTIADTEEYTSTKDIFLKIIKKGQYNISLLEIYNNPTQRDCFEIKQCLIKFYDIYSKLRKEGATEDDFTKFAERTIEEGVSIDLRLLQ